MRPHGRPLCLMSSIAEVLRANEAHPPRPPPPTVSLQDAHIAFLSVTLTGRHLKTLEFDGLDVVDESRHLLCGVHLTAGCALRDGRHR